MTPAILCATDLDRTLIYSAAAVRRWGAPGPLTAVERYRNADASFMTEAAATELATLAERCHVVPVTTRTVEQLARVRLPGRAPRWAVATNGGVLLEDGVPDARWQAAVAKRLTQVAPLREVAAHARAVCHPEWTRAVREAERLFCYAVLERSNIPAGFVDDQRRHADALGWTVSLQGSKLYWVPDPLTKSAAVNEVARRAGAGRVVSAGDSLLDADLLDAADAGVLARHGELAASGWRREHVVVTKKSGVAAGDEIVRWFAAELRARTTTDPPTARAT